MVDPFASTNPPTDANQHPSKATSTDVFGGVPDIFSDMAATAFQPIDPETGRPTEHTPETLDPFLRDDGINSPVSDFSSLVDSHDEENLQSDQKSTAGSPIAEPSDISNTTLNDSHISEEQGLAEQGFQEEQGSEPIEDISTQESISEQYIQQQDVSKPSYADAPVSPEDTTISSQEAVENTSVVSDHYDPFVDDVSHQPADDLVIDDPFLQDSTTVAVDATQSSSVVTDVVDPFLQDDFSPSIEETVSLEQQENVSTVSDEAVIDPSMDELSSSITTEPVATVSDISVDQDVAQEETIINQLDSSGSEANLSDQFATKQEAIVSDEGIPTQDVFISQENTVDQDISHDVQFPQEDVSEPIENIDANQVMNKIDEESHSLDVSSLESLSPLEQESALESQSSPDIAQSDAVNSEDMPQSKPSMVQGLVEGILDPFVSTESSSIDVNDPVVDEPSVSKSTQEESLQQTVIQDVHHDDVLPSMVDAVVEENAISDTDIVDEDAIIETSVKEDEQDMQPSGLSDIFVKFQELLARIYRVHDSRGGHDPFTVVGADNDALYITYTFAIEASVEQAIVITKESTDRKNNDTMDVHVLRFAINSNSLVEVYVDGVLLFVEDQLIDNVKAKMQLMDKFNKFIFLIDQFIYDSGNQQSGDAIASAQEEFGGF